MDRVMAPLTGWVVDRWYVRGLLFPILLAAILLGVFASLGAWWLWPVVVLLALPAVAAISAPSPPADENARWHLGHLEQ